MTDPSDLDVLIRKHTPPEWDTRPPLACQGCYKQKPPNTSNDRSDISLCSNSCGASGSVSKYRYACQVHASVTLREFARGLLAITVGGEGVGVGEYVLQEVVGNMKRVSVPACHQQHYMLGTWVMVAKYWELSFLRAVRGYLFEHLECTAGICARVLHDIEYATSVLYGGGVVRVCDNFGKGPLPGEGLGKRKRE